jgi:chromosome segregation ATPase
MQRQFAESVQVTAPTVADLFPTFRRSAPSPVPDEAKGMPVSTPTTTVLPSSDQNISQVGVRNLLDHIERRIAHFRSELELFSSFHQVVQEFNRIQSDAEHAGELKLKVEQLSERLQAIEAARAAAFERIVGLEQQVATTQQQVQQTSADLENARKERDQLLAQVKAHAEVAIEQFKNRLGANLSRLVGDLPAKQSELSPASSQVLLRQYHQFLDKLEEQGIAVRPRGENR